MARYGAAVTSGSPQARERLAYHHAREGHRLLSAGKIAAARGKFIEACELQQDQEYALLVAITEILADDVDARIPLDRLEALTVTGKLVSYRALRSWATS